MKDMELKVENTSNTAIKGNQIDPFARSSRLERSPQSRGGSNSELTRSEIKKITNTRENRVRTNNDTNYFSSWQAEKSARENLEKQIVQLRSELEKLKAIMAKSGTSNQTRIEYYTDEEELAQQTRETDWLLNESRKNKKKRKKMDITPGPPVAGPLVSGEE